MAKLPPIDAETIINRNPTLAVFHEFWTGEGFKLKTPVVPVMNDYGHVSVKLIWRKRAANASTTVTQSLKILRG